MTLPRRSRSKGLLVLRQGFWFGGHLYTARVWGRAYRCEIIGRL